MWCEFCDYCMTCSTVSSVSFHYTDDNKGGDNVISTNTAVNDDSENEIVTEEEILPMNTKDLEEINTTPTRKKKQILSNKTLKKTKKNQTERAILDIIQKDICRLYAGYFFF